MQELGDTFYSCVCVCVCVWKWKSETRSSVIIACKNTINIETRVCDIANAEYVNTHTHIFMGHESDAGCQSTSIFCFD